MTTIINSIIHLLESLLQSVYLFKSPLKPSAKLHIVLTYIMMTIKLPFTSLLGNTREKIFGYTLFGFEYKTIRFLFYETFFALEYIFASKNNQPVIIDLGANIGDTVLFFKWLFPEAKIYAFEPDKKTFGLLNKNVEYNAFTNTHLYQQAVTDIDGSIQFFIDENTPGSLTMSTNNERISTHAINVDSIKLSTFLKQESIAHIDCLKIDVEGSEHTIIQDLYDNQLLDVIDTLLIEYHHRIGTSKSQLGSFLLILEQNGFEYSLFTSRKRRNTYQDIIIHAVRQ